MKQIIIHRVQLKKQTLGHAMLLDGLNRLNFVTLEPEWLDNQKFISCIPKGEYTARVRYSKRYGRHLEIIVPDRDLILMHWGNYRKNTNGCILSGNGFKDINQDGMIDITSSRKTMSRIMNRIKDYEDIIISIT